jgi:hypothetical protein
VAKALEALDRSTAEGWDFLRRQFRDARRQGLATCVMSKLRRRLGHRAAQPQAPRTPAPAEAVDWALVDYHSKHGGCDEEAISGLLRGMGFDADLQLYDSKRHRPLHMLAQLFRTKRMLRIVATRQR